MHDVCSIPANDDTQQEAVNPIVSIVQCTAQYCPFFVEALPGSKTTLKKL